MLRRFIGLLLIASILMPIILGAAGFLLVRQIVADVEDAARGPLQDIQNRLDAMKATLDQAAQAFQGMSSLISSITNALGGIGNAINSIVTRIGPIVLPDVTVRIPVIDRNITIPIPDIPSFNVPGLTQLKSALTSMFSVFANLTDVVRRIGSLGALPQQLNGVVARLQGLVNGIGAVGSRYLGALSLIAVALLVWVSATYVALVYRWLTSGWRMLRGLPA